MSLRFSTYLVICNLRDYAYFFPIITNNLPCVAINLSNISFYCNKNDHQEFVLSKLEVTAVKFEL